MPEWITVLLQLLSQFTGVKGGVDNNIVIYGIAALLYTSLFAFARANHRNTSNYRDLLLKWGFGFGLGRELFMLVMAVIQAEGLVDPGNLHQFFPPLEHELLGLAFVMISSAYISYFTDKRLLTRHFLRGGITVTALAFLATSWWWFGYIRANPTHHFADVWCDLLFHANGTFWLLLAAYIIFRQSRPVTTRNLVVTALFFMAMSTFLKIPDIVLHEAYIGVFSPIARTLYLSAILILGYTYIHEQFIERTASEGKINHLAYYDQLTDLPNRLLLLDRLLQALASSARSGKYCALLFLDLDNFKNLNDTLGHDMGDILLKQATQRLKSCIREGDTVARLGGDEFVVMLLDLNEQSIESAAQTKAIGEKILAAIGQPYQLEKNYFRCTGSIGATVFKGHQQTQDELMKQADIAMYQAKKAGRNALRFFDWEMQESISARVALEDDLHNALKFHQFHLHYQIQVDKSGRPLGAEALIRWVHPVRGMIYPGQFIPLAEESGLILPLGQWVIEKACTQIKAWQQDARTRDLALAVNVSAKQFHQADFVNQVQAAVQHHAIPLGLLKLELTEGMLLENIELVISTMNSLNEIGVRFSLDDFGTGYSSLQYLKRLPLDQLKIDQSFVRDISTDSIDKTIVSAIIAMAQILNMDVIAEGVETEEQQQFLLNSGCVNFQGYLFGRPVPIDQFEAILNQG